VYGAWHEDGCYRSGGAFWIEARTRLTVIDDYPVGAAIVQLYPR
jgi:hypothetical protein